MWMIPVKLQVNVFLNEWMVTGHSIDLGWMVCMHALWNQAVRNNQRGEYGGHFVMGQNASPAMLHASFPLHPTGGSLTMSLQYESRHLALSNPRWVRPCDMAHWRSLRNLRHGMCHNSLTSSWEQLLQCDTKAQITPPTSWKCCAWNSLCKPFSWFDVTSSTLISWVMSAPAQWDRSLGWNSKGVPSIKTMR